MVICCTGQIETFFLRFRIQIDSEADSLKIRLDLLSSLDDGITFIGTV